MRMNHTIEDLHKLIAPKQPSKIGRVLHELVKGQSLNRFEAERQLHDHTLNSTISDLANEWGVRVRRVREQVPGYGGQLVSCVRYSLELDTQNLKLCYQCLSRIGYANSCETIELF